MPCGEARSMLISGISDRKNTELLMAIDKYTRGCFDEGGILYLTAFWHAPALVNAASIDVRHGIADLRVTSKMARYQKTLEREIGLKVYVARSNSSSANGQRNTRFWTPEKYDNKGLCWYNSTFGDNDRQCRPPSMLKKSHPKVIPATSTGHNAASGTLYLFNLQDRRRGEFHPRSKIADP